MLPALASRVVTGRDLPPLAWHLGYFNTPRRAYEPDMFTPSRTQPLDPFKPHGGWWSWPVTLADPHKVPLATAWSEYANGFSWGRNWFGENGSRVQVVRPDPDAVVYRVDTQADLEVLAEAFPATIGQSDPVRAEAQQLMWSHATRLDWAAMADAGIAAFQVTRAGRVANRHARHGEDRPVLETWDCDSVYWLRPAFTIPPAVFELVVCPPDIPDMEEDWT